MALLEKEDVLVDDLEGVLLRIEDENAKQKFWTKSEKGVIRIIHIDFKKFLEENGFYKFNPEGSKNYVFVKVTNNLIDHTSEKEIKDFILCYLLEEDDTSIYNHFADNTRFFREEFLTLLSSIDVFFIEDTLHNCPALFCQVRQLGKAPPFRLHAEIVTIHQILLCPARGRVNRIPSGDNSAGGEVLPGLIQDE